MFVLMIVLFVIGYLCIALEHPLKINKSATALLLGAVLWVCAAVGGEAILHDSSALRDYLMLHPKGSFIDWLVHGKLVEALGEVGAIIFFLLGAMTIVEVVDTQGGFKIITDKIKATNRVKLLWIISIITFVMSAVLDNLTSSIVMCALLRKLIADRHERWFFASMIIIAANSGGAWSPIGDVTTIMLWIAGKITAMNIIKTTVIASAVSLIVPLVILSFMLKGHVTRPQLLENDNHPKSEAWHQTLFLILGVAILLFVPVFKTITHLPPYLGMLGGLGILWITSELVHHKKTEEEKSHFNITSILKKIDTPSILFFLGILIAVNALQTMGHLQLLASKLDAIALPEPTKYYVVNLMIGMLSSIVDNVPLVAGAIGMYSFPTDHYFWEFLAYCAGTGGSILIIGSAAGVAVMGMEKIDFIWYLKKISWIALIGYFAGGFTYIAEKKIYAMLGGNEEKTEVFEFTEEGVKNYLIENTFYLGQERAEFEEMTEINFIEYKDLKTEENYSGIAIDGGTTNIQNNVNNHRIISSSLLLGEPVIAIDDTVAYVQIADYPLMVTQSGLVFTNSNEGPVQLKKVE